MKESTLDSNSSRSGSIRSNDDKFIFLKEWLVFIHSNEKESKIGSSRDFHVVILNIITFNAFLVQFLIIVLSLLLLIFIRSLNNISA